MTPEDRAAWVLGALFFTAFIVGPVLLFVFGGWS